MKKRWITGIAACALALGLVGCGTDTKNESRIVTLGEYKNLTYTPYEIEVTEAMIDEEIETELSWNSELKEVEGRDTIEEGDVIQLDYTVTVDGDIVEDMGETGVDVELGTMYFHDTIEAAFPGHKIGDVFEVPITYTEEDGEDESLLGKEVVYNFTIHKIQYYEVPELTEEYVKEFEGVDSIEEYREIVKQLLIESETDAAETDVMQELLDQAMENTEFELSTKQIKAKAEEIQNMYEQYAAMFNMELSEFREVFMQLDEEAFEAQKISDAQYQIQSELLMNAIAEKENIKITTDEFPALAEELASEWGYESLEELQADYTIEELMQEMVTERVTELIRSSAVEG